MSSTLHKKHKYVHSHERQARQLSLRRCTCKPKSSRPGYWKLTSMSWMSGGTSSVGSGKWNFTCERGVAGDQ